MSDLCEDVICDDGQEKREDCSDCKTVEDCCVSSNSNNSNNVEKDIREFPKWVWIIAGIVIFLYILLYGILKYSETLEKDILLGNLIQPGDLD